VEVTRVDADGHPERDLLAQHGQPAHGPQGPAHLDGGPAAAGLVVGSGEVQEEGVTAELQQAATVGHGQVEQGHEARPDGGRELLGTDPAVTGQALGQLGEARDVHEDDGARLDPEPLVGPPGQPLDAQPGEVRGEPPGFGAARHPAGGTHTRRLRPGTRPCSSWP